MRVVIDGCAWACGVHLIRTCYIYILEYERKPGATASSSQSSGSEASSGHRCRQPPGAINRVSLLCIE
eukprot:1130601-Prymnesium_polylepis.1